MPTPKLINCDERLTHKAHLWDDPTDPFLEGGAHRWCDGRWKNCITTACELELAIVRRSDTMTFDLDKLGDLVKRTIVEKLEALRPEGNDDEFDVVIVPTLVMRSDMRVRK